ncbi:MAG TPA: DivIVA domain-containing protein [Egibacteraceae bacterium]
MAITPDDIHAQTFKERFKGYDEEEVDRFLAQVADGIAELHREREQLAERVRQLEESGAGGDSSSVSETEALLRRTLVTAQRAADDTVAEARATAEQMVADAREEAETLLAEARAEAEELRARARAQAERELEHARAERERVLAAVDDLRRLRGEYAERVRAVIAEQLDLLDRTGDLPELPPDLDALSDLEPPRDLDEVRLDEESRADAGAPERP